MNFEELKNQLKKIEQQERMCHARSVRVRETYKRQNAPMKLRKYERKTNDWRFTSKEAALQKARKLLAKAIEL